MNTQISNNDGAQSGASLPPRTGSVYRAYYGQEFRFNDPVKCVTLSMMRQTPVIGRIVQVRTKCGQFGSEVYIMRHPDGTLGSYENEMLKAIDDDLPKGPDAEDHEYTIAGKYPQVGFLIESPDQPQTPGFFTMMVTTPKVPDEQRGANT
jgi:hypothetical protein